MESTVSENPVVKTGQLFRFEPSFRPFVKYLRAQMSRYSDIRVRFYKHLISKFERHPELLEPFDHSFLEEGYSEVKDLLQMALVPLTSHPENYQMAFGFVQPKTFFYYTDKFKEMLMNESLEFSEKEDEYNHLKNFLRVILEQCYGVKVNQKQSLDRKTFNYEKHTIHYYEICIDTRFIEVHLNGKLPEYQERWLEMLFLTPDRFAAEVKSFPFNAFWVEGFIIVQAEDITTKAALNHLKNAVLNIHTTPMEDVLDCIEQSLAELLSDTHLKIGITPFFKVNGKVVYDEAFITKAILIASTCNCSDDEISIDQVIEVFTKKLQPFILTSVDNSRLKVDSYLYRLKEKDIKSYMAYPVSLGNQLLGVFEIGSGTEGTITKATIDTLQAALPVITEVMNVMISNFNNKIEQLVKEKFTSLQPSVEWKFNEVAWEYLKTNPGKNNNAQIGNVVFEGVHPLYAAIDIRNSSIERNAASCKDYQKQLQTALSILNNTDSLFIPVLESIRYKCNRFLNSIHDGLTTENELKINDFFKIELEPFLLYLAKKHPSFASHVNKYLENQDPDEGDFHSGRRAYETSLQSINKNLTYSFEKDIQGFQEMYPFYFEMYRTDGIEYNIYIGSSIVPNQRFDPIYLQNLRLWQISSIAHIARLNHKMIDELPVRLQTTHLILVHNPPIAISFRKNERRFDVEGSYNIRYEIIKKRIDKIRIKGTLERLTQPDVIAIVYTNPREVDEYLQHIEYLQDKGLLNDKIETFDLEEMPGVSGLKAIRVGVKYD